ncbi:hypothetical protein PZA11_007206 [Diplocarpon coronariae]
MEPANDEASMTRGGRRKQWLGRVRAVHGRTPGINKLPLEVLGTIGALVVGNAVVWVGVGIVLAIDLMTRRLIADGQRPTTVGTFFSLGHSTIVIITSIVVAATAAAVSDRFGSFGKVGGIIGTSVSAAFLIILSLLNMWILWKLVLQLKGIVERGEEYVPVRLLSACERGTADAIRSDRTAKGPWKMYPLGVLFGLGFDTSSEVALLGIASLQGASGTSFWLILIFPILFTAGMCLLDTTDGALMMTLYTSTALARDQIAILYYSIVLTLITIAAAMAIGVIQLLSLVLNVAEPEGRFWHGVEVAGDHYDVIGGAICGSFVVAGVASVLCQGAFRRAVDKKMSERRTEEAVVIVEGGVKREGTVGESPDKKAGIGLETTAGPSGN